MGRRLANSILAIFISIVLITSGLGAETGRKALLRDGFVPVSIDGKLTRQDSNEGSQSWDRWFFQFDADVSDGISRVGAGTSLELLPSSALEKMTADVKKRSEESYRLWWPRVTRYKGRNFIFPTFFLPLSKTSKPESPTPQKPEQQKKDSQPTVSPNEPPQDGAPTKGVHEDSPSGKSGKTRLKPAIYDPNDVLVIPQEMIEKLKGSRTGTVKRRDTETVKGVTVKPLKRPLLQQDSVLADRTGFIRDSGHGARETWHEVSFVFDALGRNVQQGSLRFLPCEALERTEQEQSAELEPIRFKIAGIVTKYKGKRYLLLERATQVYSHGNFGR
jgi:hypothetical protein